MSMKNPLTPAGIEPAAFRFVAQHLNHCATTVPYYMDVQILYHGYVEYINLMELHHLLMLLLCWSGGYLVRMGVRLCDMFH